MKPYAKKQNPLDALNERIQSEDWAPAFFLHGEESFLKDKAVQKLRKSFLVHGEDDFSYRSFHFPDSDVDQVVDELGTLPFFGQRKLLLLQDIEGLKDKEAQRLIDALPKQFDGTVAVFVSTKIDRRKNVFKFLLEKTASYEFKPVFENQVGGWIRSMALEKGKDIHSEAIMTLHRRVGSQLGELDHEIEKLVTYLGERTQIESEDVEAVVHNTKSQSVFELTDSIGRKDSFQSLSILMGLISQGQSEVGVVSLIARHLRILMTAKAGLEKNFSESELAQVCGVPPYFLRQYLDQSRRWSKEELRKGLLRTSITERRLKGSGVAPEILLDSLILDLGGSR